MAGNDIRLVLDQPECCMQSPDLTGCLLHAQGHEREVVKLGPISMGERLRIGGDVSSDDDMDEGTPSPPPGSPKRSHKRRVLPPRSIDSSAHPPACV